MARSARFPDEIAKQLRITNRLLAAQLRTTMSQTELVEALASLKLTAREMADVLNTSPATIAVTLQRLRNKQRKPSEE